MLEGDCLGPLSAAPSSKTDATLHISAQPERGEVQGGRSGIPNTYQMTPPRPLLSGCLILYPGPGEYQRQKRSLCT